MVWLLFFVLLVGQTEPNKAVDHVGIAFQKSKLEYDSEQFVDWKENDDKQQTVAINDDVNEQTSKNDDQTQAIMYEMEKDNPMPIDKLLSELNIH